MLNRSLKLNESVFDTNVEILNLRKGFSDGLVIAGQVNDKVMAVCADLAESVGMEDFKKRFKERFVEVGVAEQNLVSVASGLASMGRIPFAGSYAIFNPGRNWEQIRTNICYNDRPVKIIGTHAGLNVGPDGGSHQALEDIALMRVLPNMIVLSPCDYHEAKRATLSAVKINKPVYIRLPREKSTVITSESTPYEIGKAYTIYATAKAKADVAIIATGPILYNALLAGKEIEKKGRAVKVINLPTIKPLDEHAILEISHETGCIVTVEEHQIYGGMGSAIAEFLAKNNPVPIEMVGVKDEFGQSGTAHELFLHYGLGIKDIVKATLRVAMRRKS